MIGWLFILCFSLIWPTGCPGQRSRGDLRGRTQDQRQTGRPDGHLLVTQQCQEPIRRHQEALLRRTARAVAVRSHQDPFQAAGGFLHRSVGRDICYSNDGWRDRSELSHLVTDVPLFALMFLQILMSSYRCFTLIRVGRGKMGHLG